MGASTGDTEAFSDESPRHEVELTRPFVLLRTPVTQAQWSALMGTSPSHFAGPDRPVERVSWYDALAYCNALSRSEGYPDAYALWAIRGRPGEAGFSCQVEWNRGSNGYRLPTEAEWEYACRAGTVGPRYGAVGEVAWYRENSGGKTMPVRSRAWNPWGLYDMLGNVWEWCWDASHRTYTPPRAVDPIQDGADAAHRVLRGGARSSDARRVRASYRFASGPGDQRDDVGFRPARYV
jgi:formylglycine-generating enzyme required for sulfatase activity